MHPINQDNFGYNGISCYYGDGSGASYTSYVVKQTGTFSYIVTNDGVTLVYASLVPIYDDMQVIQSGQMTIIIQGPNGVEFVTKLYSKTCVTSAGNVYDWSIDNSVDGSYVINSYAFLQS